MANEIIPYLEMCQREGASLQRGMNFGLGGNHSVILMSVRPNAPYDDRLEDGGTTLIYEGHDLPRTKNGPEPKSVDQPEFSDNGRPTQNGLFHRAAQAHKKNGAQPERVRVYEKLRAGIWSYNGVFHLVDSWRERSGARSVFKFRLEAVEGRGRLYSTGAGLHRPSSDHPNSGQVGGLEARRRALRKVWRHGRAPLRPRPTLFARRDVGRGRERSAPLRSTQSPKARSNRIGTLRREDR